MLFIKLLQSLPNIMLPKTSYKSALNMLVTCCFSVILASCVSSGGKSKEPNITSMDEINLDQVEYADHENDTEQTDDRFSMPEESDNAELNPYDNPQYADDSADPYDNPQYAEGENQDVDAADMAVTDAYDNPEYAEGADIVEAPESLEGVDLAELDAQTADEAAVSSAEVPMGIDDGGQVAVIRLTPVDLEVKFGPNPYLQNPPVVSAEASAEFSQAISLMREENWDEASEILEKISDENSDLSGPAYNRAVIAYTKNDLKLALKWLNIALGRNAYNLNAKNLKANIFKKQSKFSEAESEYKEIIALWGAYLPAYKNLGILYDLYMGKLRLALEQYRLYDSLVPKEDTQVTGWIAVIERQLPVEEVPVEVIPAEADISENQSTDAPAALDQLAEGSEDIPEPAIEDSLEGDSGISDEDSALPAIESDIEQVDELPVDEEVEAGALNDELTEEAATENSLAASENHADEESTETVTPTEDAVSEEDVE